MSQPLIVGPRDRQAVLHALAQGDPVVLPTYDGYQVATPYGGGEGRPGPDGSPHVLVGHRRQVADVATEWTPDLELLTARAWPGPLTVMARVGDGGWRFSPAMLRPVRALCRESGPFWLTALADHDGSNALTAAQAASLVSGGSAALVVDGGTINHLGATVVDGRVSPLVVRHVGALPAQFIEATMLMAQRRHRWFRRSAVTGGPDAG